MSKQDELVFFCQEALKLVDDAANAAFQHHRALEDNAAVCEADRKASWEVYLRIMAAKRCIKQPIRDRQDREDYLAALEQYRQEFGVVLPIG